MGMGFVLVSGDGKTFTVSAEVVSACQTISGLVEEDLGGGPITLPNVDGAILAVVVDFLGRPPNSEDRATFVAGLDRDVLLNVVSAATYLNCRALVHASCEAVSKLIKNCTVEEMRRRLFDDP